MFAYSVGDLVVSKHPEIQLGVSGKVLKRELMAGFEYYLVSFPESDTWLMEESLTVA
jgi:hypothetical protein